MARSRVAFGVLGPLTLTVDGRCVEIGSRKQRMLLSALLAEAGTPVSADALTELLWAGAPPSSAALTLRSLVSRIRRAMGPAADRLVRLADGYLLRTEPQEVDADLFERLRARARGALASGQPEEAAAALRQALDLWRGPPLSDLRDTEFGRVATSQLAGARAATVEDLAEAELAAGRPAAAIACLEPHLLTHPLHERGWEHLILALYRTGRQADALAAYVRARRLLHDELGVEPSPALRRLQARILAQDPSLAGDPPGGHAPLKHNLPVALTPLIGRTEDLAAMARELANGRLLTLTGVAGVGKTRLAIQVARDTADSFDAVRLVELAALDPGDDVAAPIARELDVTTADGSTGFADRLAERLAARRVLLVLDNCEHVLPGAARMAALLLRHCPASTVLATSREPLGVTGEVIWPVLPLSLPEEDASSIAELADSAAVALFLQRGAAAQIGFGLTAANAAAIGQICRRLDGIPLALELAASRLRALAAEQIAARLDDRFELLTCGDRTAPVRQQTLRATVEWSYQLLAPDEQAALRSLSVFPADFDIDAAAAVARAPGATGEDIVYRLVDKSLVVTRRQADMIRYSMLDTIRSYAGRLLAEAGELDAARWRHRQYFCDLLIRCPPFGPPIHNWNRSLAFAEEQNLRAAAGTAISARDGDAALRLAAGLWATWMTTGQAEPLDLLEQALALGGTDLVARADVTTGLALLSSWWEIGPPDRPMQLFAEARALADRSADAKCRYRAYFFHAEVLAQRGNRVAALAAYREALRGAPDSWSPGTRHTLGWMAWADGDTATAQREFEGAVRHAGTSDWHRSHATLGLGLLAAAAGRRHRAIALAGEGLSTARRPGLNSLQVMALLRAAQIYLLCDEDAAAKSVLKELFTLLHQLGTRQFRVEALEAVALIARRMGEEARAAAWLRAADALRLALSERGSTIDVLGTALAPARLAAKDLAIAEARNGRVPGPPGHGLPGTAHEADATDPSASLPRYPGAEAIATARAWLDGSCRPEIGERAVAPGVY